MEALLDELYQFTWVVSSENTWSWQNMTGFAYFETATKAIFRPQICWKAGTADGLLTAAKEAKPVCDARPVWRQRHCVSGFVWGQSISG